MVGGVGVNLSFKAESRAVLNRLCAFALEGSVKEVARVKLDAGEGC